MSASPDCTGLRREILGADMATKLSDVRTGRRFYIVQFGSGQLPLVLYSGAYKCDYDPCWGIEPYIQIRFDGYETDAARSATELALKPQLPGESRLAMGSLAILDTYEDRRPEFQQRAHRLGEED